MVCFGIRVASLLGECLGVVILCCPSFLPFYDIFNLTLTLYLKAKPSVETVVVHVTNLALIFPFYRLNQSQKSSRGRQRKTVVNLAVDDVSLSFFSFF